jgi:hypothetical protein
MLVWKSIHFEADEGSIDRVIRAKVPGGWLVHVYFRRCESGAYNFGNGGPTFLTDPQHEWDGESLPGSPCVASDVAAPWESEADNGNQAPA